MSGPGSKCSEEGIAYVRLQVATIFLLFPPGDNRVLEDVFASLQRTGQGVIQYVLNIKRGIKTGMINSKEDCLSGLKCVQAMYSGFGVKRDGMAILNWFRPDSYVFNMTNFLKFLNAKPQQVNEWQQKYNATYEVTMRRILVEYVGKPLDDLIHYLKNEHILYCIPQGVINGLGELFVFHFMFELRKGGGADKEHNILQELCTAQKTKQYIVPKMFKYFGL